MTASAEQNRTQSLGILAIVGGVVFSAMSALVIAVVVLLLYLGYRQMQTDGQLAQDGPVKDQHIRDTGTAGPIENVQPVAPGPRRGRTGGDPAPVQPTGPQPGPATLIVPNTMVFLSIEVNCPSGYRSRGTFRKDTNTTMKATVQNVPPDERCTVTFQGSEPAKTWISGNQTKSCTFNPVVCSIVY